MVERLSDPVFLEGLIKETDGVKVVFADATETFGHRDTAEELAFETGQVIGEQDVVRVPTGKVPAAIRVGDAITVDGAAKKVADHRNLDDGAITMIALEVV